MQVREVQRGGQVVNDKGDGMKDRISEDGKWGELLGNDGDG